jgi:hypothetical protein
MGMPEQTDPVREQFDKICGQRQPKESLSDLLAEKDSNRAVTCKCINGKAPAEFAKFCAKDGHLDRWEKKIRELYSDVQKQKNYPVPEVECTDYLVEERIWLMSQTTKDDCSELPFFSFKSRWALPKDQGKCSRLTELDAEGCLIESDCKTLAPLRRLCHPGLSRTQKLKDPFLQNYPFRSALLNYLTHGEAYTHRAYSAANCHGTAQMLHGNFLGSFPVTAIRNESGLNDPQCLEAAQTKWGTKKSVPADELGAKGGTVVNMKYRDCKDTDAGTAYHSVRFCEDGVLTDHIQILDMCVLYWGKQIETKLSYRRLDPKESWSSWVPGCLFTQSDHTITLLHQNNGFCFFYETTTAYGASRLNVQTCPEIASNFSYKWCPKTPLTFVAPLLKQP